jgi:predicted ferric reductase
MTVATQSVARRTVLPPVVAARAVMWTVIVVNLLIVEALFFTSSGGKNQILTVAKWFGLHTSLTMMFQLLLIARIPWIERRLGMDRLTVWHRWIGFTLFWTVLTHGTLIVLGYATLDGVSMFKTFGALAGVTASLLGMSAAAIVLFVGVTSIRLMRRKVLSYEVWHSLHILLYVAIGLGLVHQYLEPASFSERTISKVYWWTMWAIVLTTLFVGRVVMPIWRNVYHRFRVAAVVPESDNVVSVHVTGRNMDKLPFRAGQFCIWRFPGHFGVFQANPFSLSSAPNGRSIRLTAKAVGKTSAGLRQVPVGTRVFIEGPYGAFTSLHQIREASLLIAGGVGITPIRSLLEESVGSVVVLYRVNTMADAVLLPELQALARDRGARLHVLTGRTGEGQPPNTPFEPQNLAALVPDIVHRDVFVCGPPAMTNAVLRTLRALNVPRLQVHSERFGFA